MNTDPSKASLASIEPATVTEAPEQSGVFTLNFNHYDFTEAGIILLTQTVADAFVKYKQAGNLQAPAIQLPEEADKNN